MLCWRNIATWTVGRVVAEAKQRMRGDETRRATEREQCADYAGANSEISERLGSEFSECGMAKDGRLATERLC
jgi:hypothetical protein